MTRLMSSFKSTELNFNFGKVLMVLILIFTFVFQGVTPVSANPNIKTMTVTVGEGGVDQSSLSKVINIPNLQSIESITTNTGSVSHTKNGENVTINASGGSSSRSENNPYKYSKYVNDYSTSSSDSFSNTKNYNSGGYSGTLTKSGGSFVSSGSPADSKVATHTRSTWVREYKKWNGTDWISDGYDTNFTSTYNYSSGGYTGILSYTNTTYGPVHFYDPPSNPVIGTRYLYRNESNSSVSYSGTVSKPDTRIYRQDYSGTVYQAGTDYYYKYIVTIEYIDNQEPVINATVSDGLVANGNSYFGKEVGHNAIYFEGEVKDNDTDDEISIKYTLFNNDTSSDLDGHTNVVIKSNLSSGSGINHSFNYTINVDETIPDGKYTLKVIAEDDKGGKAEKNTIIFIDNTGPVSILNPENVVAKNTSSIEIKPTSTDNMVDLRETETYLYNRDGGNIGEWTGLNPLTDTGLKANKKYIYKFKAIDKLNNEGDYSNTIERYTLALDPTEVQLIDYSTNSLTLTVVNNIENDEVPETKLIAKKKGTNEVICDTGWSLDATKILTDLVEGEEYEIYLNVRNGDLVTNYPDEGELSLNDTSEPKLTDSDGNPINDIRTNRSPNNNIDNIIELKGKYFSENEGYNMIDIIAKLKDDDIGDMINIKYNIKQDGVLLPLLTDKVLVADIVTTGEEQTIKEKIVVNSTIPEGEITLELWAEDDRGGKSSISSINLNIDKTGPITTAESIEVLSDSSIKIDASAIDAGVGLHETQTFIYNRNGEDITPWSTENFLIDEGLTANKEYSFKVKSKDKLDNIGDYSNILKKYTLALNPVKVQFIESSNNSITLNIVNNDENEITPDTKIILKEKGTNTVVATADWSKDELKILNGLVEGKEYEVYLNVRNEDGVKNYPDNEELRLTASSDPSLVDINDKPLDGVVTVIPVSNFKLIGSSVSTLKVSWDKVNNQEYQLWLVDTDGIEVIESRSSWFSDSGYKFEDIGLLPNTKYIPHISTRRINSSFSMPPVVVENTSKSFTNAEGISKGSFESGEDYIKITLIVDSLNNPSYTEYEIKNDVTDQKKTITHSNPIWKNTNLSKESYYSYSVRVINKNEEPSYFTRLTFTNGEEPHTYIPDLDISDDVIDKPDYGDVINLDDLKTWDTSKPVEFNPEELNNKAVQLNGEIFVVTQNKMETIKNKEKVEVAYYAFSKEGFGYSDWKELNEGFFEDKVHFNIPGYYKTHFKFKDYIRESSPLIINYLADWISPNITIAENKIKGQTVVTNSNFDIRLGAEDNISEYLFYSLDNGVTYYLLKDDITDISFTNINKSSAGVLNNLSVRVCDINGNVVEKMFSVWGINK